MSDIDPSAPILPAKPDVSELHGLDPGELLVRGLDTVKPSVGASTWEPPTIEEVGRLLPQYRIESLLGRGGMGAVYKGIQLNLDRAVAIKLLPAEIAADAQFVTRFEREARTLAKLQHSRIVTIHDFGRTSEGHLYFVMEYVDGTDLRRILRGPGLDPEQALAVVGQLCDALQVAHREGVVHRDIKPENVLITRDGYVKLVDFGLSRPPEVEGASVLTNTNVVMGTPDYMAPEQRDGAAKADPRSDIFALGVMFYEMLTGQTPRGVFEPPSHKVQVDVRIDQVVLKALQSEPERRYQKVSELKTAIDDIRTTPLPAAATPPATPGPVAPPRKKSNVPVLAGVGGGLLLLALAAVLLWPGRKHGSAPAEPQLLPGRTSAMAVVSAHEPSKATPAPLTPAARRAAQVYDAMVHYNWAWTNVEGNTKPQVVEFAWDGHVSGGWLWELIYKLDGETIVHCNWNGQGHQYLKLNETCDAFDSFDSDGKLVVRGQRLGPVGQAANLAELPTSSKATPAPLTPAARRAAQVYDAMVHYNWTWTNVGGNAKPQVVEFIWDGHVSGGWLWELIYKLDGETVVHCNWNGNGHQYLQLNETCDAFEAFDSDGKLTVRGERLGPVGQPVNLAELHPKATPAPLTLAALRAAQVYDAIVHYNWAWMNVDGKRAPLVVEFAWDGHVSGGWTWELVYKPDGETLVHCNWNGNGHQYLQLNETCDSFDSFDSDGQFNVKGKRLGPVDQPVNLAGLPTSQPAAGPVQKTPPSKQVEPLLEPTLNAILAPLEANPPMPRVAVEKLRASLGAGVVTARTPAQRQIYQYGMAVCEALTYGMDERAQARIAAIASTQVPSLSAGAGIVKSMPLHGWDAGRAGEAIRKKEKDERRYLDKQAQQVSIFTETGAYRAWVARSAFLRANAMSYYAKLVQLEAADAATEAAKAGAPQLVK